MIIKLAIAYVNSSKINAGNIYIYVSIQCYCCPSSFNCKVHFFNEFKLFHLPLKAFEKDFWLSWIKIYPNIFGIYTPCYILHHFGKSFIFFFFFLTDHVLLYKYLIKYILLSIKLSVKVQLNHNRRERFFLQWFWAQSATRKLSRKPQKLRPK